MPPLPQPPVTPPPPRDEPRWEISDFSYEGLLELGSLAVPTGLDRRQLAKLKPKPYAHRDPPEDVDCAVCIEKMLCGEAALRLPCGHEFHHQCIVTWLSRSNKCPTCRFEIRRTDPPLPTFRR